MTNTITLSPAARAPWQTAMPLADHMDGCGLWRPALSNTTDKQRLEMLRRHLEHHFCHLMSRSESDGIGWRGTQADLVEITHLVWERQFMLDEMGRPLTFSYMVRRMARIVHVAPPPRPTVVMNNIRRRKTPNPAPMMSRLYALARPDDIFSRDYNPLHTFVAYPNEDTSS